ncbi:MAG: hypothetical protein WC955_05140 [Elusimicrobiota bacterium]
MCENNFVAMTKCIGCGGGAILLDRRLKNSFDKMEYPVICDKCGGNNLPLNTDMPADKMALAKCRECGKFAAVLEVGIVKIKDKEGNVQEKTIKPGTIYAGICSKCLGDDNNVVVNLNKKGAKV